MRVDLFSSFKKSVSLKTRLILLLFALFIFLSILVTTITIASIRSTMTKDVGRSRIEILKQVVERETVVCNNIRAVSNLYYNDARIRALVFDKSVLNYEELKYLFALDIRYAYSFESIGLTYYAAIVSKNGVGYYSQTSGANPKLFNINNTREAYWYDDVIKANGDIVWISNYNISTDEEEPDYMFSAVRAFIDGTTNQYSGMVIINVRERSLYNLYSDLLSRDNVIYILNTEKTVITHPDQAMLGTKMLEQSHINFDTDYKVQDDMFITKYKDPVTGWIIIEEIPLSNVYKDINRIEKLILLVVLICCVVSVFVIVAYSRRIVSPIKSLCTDLERIGTGILDPVTVNSNILEIIKIKDVINKMVKKLGYLMEDIKKHEKLKRRSDVEYLQAQINPHFIYNMLFSIKCMVEMGKNKQAENMIYEFVNLLKNKLDVSSEYITMAKEMEGVKGYIKIQKIRYSDAFQENIRVDSTVVNHIIPRMIVLPIVENAFFHGIEPCDRLCELRITVKRRGAKLIIEICDNGIGIEKDKIANIWSEPRSRNHIGLKNVNKRIQLYFGEEYGLNIYSKHGFWTKVVITLPVLLT